MNNDYHLITCVVQRGKADSVWAAAQRAGAAGATVFFARGMGVRERLGLLGIAIAPEKEVLQLVTRAEETERIFAAIVEAAGLDTPGMGFAFTTPVYQAAGFAPASSPPTS
jgi:nitrogen regulatory protein PII